MIETNDRWQFDTDEAATKRVRSKLISDAWAKYKKEGQPGLTAFAMLLMILVGIMLIVLYKMGLL